MSRDTLANPLSPMSLDDHTLRPYLIVSRNIWIAPYSFLAQEKCWKAAYKMLLKLTIGNIKPNDKEILKSKSAFEVLLQRNPEAAELILNQSIEKYNDLDSPELVIVFDFELFLRECESSTPDQMFDEMAVHSKVIDITLDNYNYNYRYNKSDDKVPRLTFIT